MAPLGGCLLTRSGRSVVHPCEPYPMLRRLPYIVALVTCSACAGGQNALPKLPTPGQITEASALAVASISQNPNYVSARSAEVYARVARGANKCWFGPHGRFAATHIFHAAVDPAASGGAVEINVHKRAYDQPKPWGAKAFRVRMTQRPGLDGTPDGGGTDIKIDNLKFSDVEATRMRADVLTWAAGTLDCMATARTDQPGSEHPRAGPQTPASPAKTDAKRKPNAGQTTRKIRR